MSTRMRFNTHQLDLHADETPALFYLRLKMFYPRSQTGWLFGDKVATEFNHVNGLKLIARAHQLVNEGYKVR